MRLKKTFGGRLKFFGIGGAKLDGEVESFLRRAGFPYSIGYGLTETAPLIGYARVGETVVGSFGYPAYGVQMRLEDVNPETGEGVYNHGFQNWNLLVLNMTAWLDGDIVVEEF